MAGADENETPRNPQVEFYLAGDLSSPFEVLSANELSKKNKREVLEVWHADLMRRGGVARHGKLLADIEFAMASLAHERSGDGGMDR